MIKSTGVTIMSYWANFWMKFKLFKTKKINKKSILKNCLN